MRMLLISIISFLVPFALATIPELRQADRDSFPEYLTGLTLVEFFSPNCYHCRQYKRVIRKIDRFIHENTEALHQMKLMQYNCKGGYYCQELGLEAIPALRLYLNSLLLGTLDGVAHTDEVVKWIIKLIRKNQRIIHQAMRAANGEYEIEVESSSDFSSDEELETEGQDTERPEPVQESPVTTLVSLTTTLATSTPLAMNPASTTTTLNQITTTPAAPVYTTPALVTPVYTTPAVASTTPMAVVPAYTTPIMATPLMTTPLQRAASTQRPAPHPHHTTPHHQVGSSMRPAAPSTTRMHTAVHHTTRATTTPHRVPTPTPKPSVSHKAAPLVQP